MITAGIVGLGWWGQVLVDAVHAKSDAIRFTASATRTRSEAAQAYAADRGIALRDGVSDLLDDAALDAVVLATPHSTHRDQIVAAATAGKHVFAEKPLTLTVAEAVEVVTAMNKADRVLGLGFQRRFHPEMTALREAVRTGALGTVLQIAGTLSASIALTLPATHWRSDDAEAPAGGLTPLGVHAIDSIIDLAGPVRSVYCASARRAVDLPTDDTTGLILELESGTLGYVGTLLASGLCYRLQVFGSHGWSAINGYPEFERVEHQPVDGPFTMRELAPFDMIRAELEAFAASVETGTPFPIPQDQMIHGVAVLEAAVRSARTGAPQPVGA